MKKIYIIIFLLFHFNNIWAQIGVNVEVPTEAIDIDGKVRIRNTDPLTANEIIPLYIDESGVIGTTNFDPVTPQTTFVNSGVNRNVVADFNAGNTIQLALTNGNVSLNTLNATIANNTIQINSPGTYQLSGSLNALLATGAINNRVFFVFQIERSTNNGSTWVPISGIKSIFIMAISGTLYYITVLPIELIDLNQNDLLRMVAMRGRNSSGVLEGANLTSGNIRSYNQHGTRAYTLSLSKF